MPSGPVLLRDYLDANEETQSAFAARAGVDCTLISAYLSERRGPDVASAVAIEEATSGAVPVKGWVRHDGRRRPPKRLSGRSTPKKQAR